MSLFDPASRLGRGAGALLALAVASWLRGLQHEIPSFSVDRVSGGPLDDAGPPLRPGGSRASRGVGRRVHALRTQGAGSATRPGRSRGAVARSAVLHLGRRRQRAPARRPHHPGRRSRGARARAARRPRRHRSRYRDRAAVGASQHRDPCLQPLSQPRQPLDATSSPIRRAPTGVPTTRS